MHNVSNTTRSISDSETSGEAGNFTAPLARKVYQDLKLRANAVPIIRIFNHYGLRLDAHNPKVACPFKSHKGGREATPSFKYYAETNSYCCFGCRVGSFGVDFVAEMEGCSKEKAAIKILDLFSAHVDEDLMTEGQNTSERLQIMMLFSNCVLDFQQDHTGDHASKFIEHMCRIYDDVNLLHKPDNEALRDLVEELIAIINIYDPCLKLSF